jgi:hypothetical protein
MTDRVQRWGWAGIVIASATAWSAASCVLPDLDLEGRPCPCTDGYVCDTVTNTCVRGDPTATTTTSSSGGEGGSGASSAGGAGGTGGDEPRGTGTCDDPFTLSDPGSAASTTIGAGNDLDAECTGGEGPDLVYRMTVAETGVLDVSMWSVAEMILYVWTDCADPTTEIACTDVAGVDATEYLAIPVTQGDTVYIVVDGHEGEESVFSLDALSRPIICGDDVVDPGEECEPPNVGQCDGACQLPPEECDDAFDNDEDGLIDCEDTGDCADECSLGAQCGAAPTLTASVAGDTSGGTGDFTGSCVGNLGVGEALFEYLPAQTGVLLLDLLASPDLGIYVRTDCEDPSSELFCVDAIGGDTSELFLMPVVGGMPVTVFVDGFEGQSGAFDLDTLFFASTEAEPNATPVQASAPASPVVGTIFPADDQDWIEVVVPPGGASITATVLDFGTDTCTLGLIESQVEIYDTDGSTSLAYDEGGCASAAANGLVAGTYFVRVASPSPFSSAGTFGYQLQLLVQ